jgi:hypothetical protein
MEENRDVHCVPMQGKAAELKRDVLQLKLDWIIQDLERIRDAYDLVIFLEPREKKPEKEDV